MTLTLFLHKRRRRRRPCNIHTTLTFVLLLWTACGVTTTAAKSPSSVAQSTTEKSTSSSLRLSQSTSKRQHHHHPHHHRRRHRRHPTRLSGYASRYSHPQTHEDDHSPHENDNHHFPLRLTQNISDGSLLLHHVPSQQTVRIQPSASFTDHLVIDFLQEDDKNDVNNTLGEIHEGKPSNNTTNTIPLQALVGVYALPSGHVWIWLASSKSAYTSVATPGNETANSALNRTSTPLYNIRQATDLHMVHVPYQSINHNSTTTTTSRTTRVRQRVEQSRQVALWRQAWKDHTWYYVPPSNDTAQAALVPDMTRSLQSLWVRHNGTIPPAQNTTSTTDINSAIHNTTTPAWYHPSAPNHPDERFFWNKPGLSRLQADAHVAHQCLLDWAVPLTSAFVGVRTDVSLQHHNVKYDHLLVSRRSRWRAGTRFTKRGADAAGRVANYVETEQVVVIRRPSGDLVQSHVQTRGSLPLRWSSPTDIKTYRPRVYIGTDPVAQARALQRHLATELVQYTRVNRSVDSKPKPALVLVNLVDNHSDQGRLGRALEAVLQAVLDVYTESPDATLPALQQNGVRHVWFDFHAELKGGRWDRLQSLLADLQDTLLEHGYFQMSVDEHGIWRAEKCQSGVIRTNCMDCLDRTNVVQGILARQMLVAQLSRLLPLASKTIYRKNPLTLPWTEGEKAHRLLWADNADAISRLYAGTPALKGDFTRTGKRTKKGALDDGMNSLQRYYLNNFLDADRQEGIDLLTGQEEFNVLSEDDEAFDDTVSNDWSRENVMNMKDAARELLLGATWQDIMERRVVEDDSDHVRIKVKSGVKPSWSGKKRELGLLWLPGDLQSLMRDLVSKPTSTDLPDELPADPAMRAMDKRASSETPWWIQASSSSDDGETTPKVNGQTAGSGTGYVLAAVVASFQAPLTTALLVLGIVGASFLNGSTES